MASKHREARILALAKHRCRNPNAPAYAYYGGRGVTFSDAFDKFEDFIAHIGWAPSIKHTLERIDNTRGYEPGNVRWATRLEQANNMRSNHRIEALGQRHTLAEWGRLNGIDAAIIRKRIKRGWSPDDAVTISPRPQGSYSEWKERAGPKAKKTQKQQALDAQGVPIAYVHSIEQLLAMVNR